MDFLFKRGILVVGGLAFLFQLPAWSFGIPEDDETIVRMGEASQESLNPKNISVLVWNTEKAKNRRYNSGFKKLAKHKDILILQEAYGSKKAQDSYRDREGFVFEFAISFFDKSNVPTGVGTASRVDSVNVDFQRSVGREARVTTPKIILFSEYPMAGKDKPLLVVNIHALNVVQDSVQRRQLADALDKINQFEGPVIFAGDFNTWGPNRAPHLLKTMKSNGFKEVK